MTSFTPMKSADGWEAWEKGCTEMGAVVKALKDAKAEKDQIDPAVAELLARKEQFKVALEAAIEAAVREMIGAFGPQKYIANLGSGLMGWESPEKVAFLVDTIHKVSEETIAAEK